MAELTEIEALRKAFEQAKEMDAKREHQPPAPPQRIPCNHCGGRTSRLGKSCPVCDGRGYRELPIPPGAGEL